MTIKSSKLICAAVALVSVGCVSHGSATSEPQRNIYWGDLHNHCNVTYGHGDLTDALDAARQQLDFVSVTPHAMWPDIPGRDDERLAWVIDYHTGAFDRLRNGGWTKYVETMKRYDAPDEGFLTFISYECHSMRYGDHVALFRDLDVPTITECTSVPDLKAKLKGSEAFVTPHHMGYITGYRGYNWNFFEQGDMTPFVEMFSRHGLAEDDLGDYQYLHDMGPRIYEGTIRYGLERGFKFGIMGSTDQHAGYPGSYGDGRIAVLAASLDRNAIWEAMRARHVYCVTGDKIKIDFRLNGAIMGDEISARRRNISLAVEASNFIDYVDIVKNGRILRRISFPVQPTAPQGDTVRAKVKIDFGWNREEQYVHWTGDISIDEGVINDVESCFRGAAYTSPQPGKTEFKTMVNHLTHKDLRSVGIDLYTTKNPNTLTPATQAVILDVTMPREGHITASVNGQRISYTLAELLEGTKAHFMRGWLSEAVQFHRAATPESYKVDLSITDDKADRKTDYYYVRVRQRDNQWAWSSPIWVNRR